MTDPHPPPTYSQEDPTVLAPGAPQIRPSPPHGPQILILPTVDAISFQSGYLGAEEERAALEGEVQIKDIDHNQWSKLTISLRTYEAAYHQEIELNFKEIILHTQETGVPFPSSLPFSIPLPSDTPQSLQTPHSSLAHTLTASLHPIDAQFPALSRNVTAYTRRYTSHTHTLPISPEAHILTEPTRVEIQVSRTSFKVGEPIPVYITVPPPPKEIVVDRSLRLRNARVELVRVVKVKREVTDDMGSDPDSDVPSPVTEPQAGASNDAAGADDMTLTVQSSSTKAPLSPLFLGSSYKTVLARSGASCHFHFSRPIRLRFLLHPSSASRSPSATQNALPGSEYSEAGFDTDAASISQVTLLHSITFYLLVRIAFLDTKQQSERTSTVKIPIRILPPPARLPEISQTFDEAYSKKHDRPPAETNRYDDSDWAVPHYSEGEAGPSMLHGAAPPPFEERDAPPPPFFSSAAEASTSARLPTFLESEREVLMPESSFPSLNPLAPLSPIIEGEGSRFGFHAAEQFDGHVEEMPRSMTPPPSMEMAAGDTNLTALTEMRESSEAIEALAHVLDQHEDSMIPEEQPPPPPPAMDDPSDPPPSIDDSVFRRPEGLERTSHSPPPIPVYHQDPPILPPPGRIPPTDIRTADNHAPPPYPVPDAHHDQENASRPPPYSMG